MSNHNSISTSLLMETVRFLCLLGQFIIRRHVLAEITVKVKANMRFDKIFETAEVCRNVFRVITYTPYSLGRNALRKNVVRGLMLWLLRPCKKSFCPGTRFAHTPLANVTEVRVLVEFGV